MKHFSHPAVALEPLPDDPSRRRRTPVEVELRALVPNYENLPDDQEAYFRPIVQGWAKFEVEARERGLWHQVWEEARRTGEANIAEPGDRLTSMFELYKRLRDSSSARDARQ